MMNLTSMEYFDSEHPLLWWLPINISSLSSSFVSCLEGTSDRVPQEKLAIFARINFSVLLMKACPTLYIERPFLLPNWQQLAWTLLFGAMLSVAIIGNVLVLWIIQAHRRMRTVTNCFLMNLSVADLFMTILNCMFNFIYMLHSDWPFGAVYCTISNFMANATIAASVFTLSVISVDRYTAIVRPLQPRMSKARARITICFIWMASLVLSIPCLLFSETVSITYKNEEIRRGCILRWPDGKSSMSKQEHIYNIIFFLTTYLLPVLLMIICYSLIGKALWGSVAIGELTDRQLRSIRSKRRVVRMFMVVVAVFTVCWLPQQAFFLYQFHNSDVMDSDHIQHTYLAFYWLAMANAMFNPIVYYYMNARFRNYFKEFSLRCLCMVCRKRQYAASPEIVQKDPFYDDRSSRSRSEKSMQSDSRNNNKRYPSSQANIRDKNHLLVYSARTRNAQGSGTDSSSQMRNGAEKRLHECGMCLRNMNNFQAISMSELRNRECDLHTLGNGASY